MGEMKDISKQPLIEWGGQVVITTAQLAEAYGATTNNIKDNFSRNKDRFTEGRHYILLTGQTLKEFKNQAAESDLVAKNTSQLYLWTRRGASRHCKILGTDKAWEQFDYLEENYFDRQGQEQKQQTQPLTLQQQIQTIAKGTDELYQRVDVVESRIADLENTMTLDHGQQYFLEKTVNKTVLLALGGKDTPAYKGIGRKVFAECNHDLKEYFNVNARANIPKKRFDAAVEYARKWKPCTNTAMLIAEYNAQQTLDLEGGAR